MTDLNRPVVLFVDAYLDLLLTMETLNELDQTMQIVTASNCEEARNRFCEYRSVLRSVFVDSYLPEFAQFALVEQRKGPPFQLVAIYSHKLDHDEMVAIGVDQLIQKPFTLDGFWELVRKSENPLVERLQQG